MKESKNLNIFRFRLQISQFGENEQQQNSKPKFNQTNQRNRNSLRLSLSVCNLISPARSLSTTMERSLRKEDRISQLPEPLLLQILSSLPTKDVVATSLLSKQWKSLWKMMPKIDFDYHNIEKSEDETFSEIVCKVLLSNKAPVLESLDINFSLDACGAMDIGMWIGMAYARGVRKLLINVESEEDCCFKFPKSLYNCETLETLELTSWVLIDVPSQACLNSLRTLSLRSAKYEDEESFDNLLSGCPKLENLEVHRHEPDGGIFTIASPSVQRLTICDDNDGHEYGGYEINAPSLKYLKIQGFKGLESVLIENAPELVEAHILNVSEITNEKILGSLTSVKRLSLALSPFEITFPTGIIFNLLVNLELSTHQAEWWNLLLLMLDSSPKLRNLKLSDSRRYLSEHWRKNNHVACGKWSLPKKVPECLSLTLEVFMWESYKHCLEEETEVAKYILGNANRLKRATFSAKPLGDFNSQEMMVEELKSVVRASNSCQLVFE